MLKELNIKNFAIIEDLNISFNKGMSVFLGETGAGKSIIINAFSLLIGERALSNYIREGQNKAFVEAVVRVDDVDDELLEFKEDDNDFIFTRTINIDGNNTCKINGKNVPTSKLKATLGKMVNIYSQHDLYYLLNPNFHLSLLDKFNSQVIKTKLENYRNKYKVLLEKKEKLKQIIEEKNVEDIEYLKFQLQEINDLDLKEDEIESLELEINRIRKMKKISDSINYIENAFSSDNGILDLLYNSKKNMNSLSDDPVFSKNIDKIEKLHSDAYDVYIQIRDDYRSLSLDETRVGYLEDRIYKINKIRRKFGNSYKEIMDSKNNFIEKINFVENKDEVIRKLNMEINDIKEECLALSDKITSTRKEIAISLEENIKKELKDLFLDKTLFKVEFKESELTIDGKDVIEFMITTNVGESLKPLARVVSGGETSRITLGLNAIFNKIYGIKIAIFDEIDSGVSGKVATALGKKIKGLSNDYQVIVISHLPQVIAKSDNFYYVGKKIENMKTKTFVEILENDRKILEIAKILSGSDNPSNLFISNAEELLNNNF